MSTPYLGQISIFSFDFAPRGWALCNGQILSIAQNTALFSLVGTFYGGDGRSTFALPNLQGLLPVGMGQGPGLSSYNLGQIAGQETHTLTVNEMASHTHSVKYTAAANAASPAGNLWAPDPNGNITFANTGDEQMANNASVSTDNAIGLAGGGQPHPNLAPALVLNFCIALQGIFPSRN